MSEWKEYKISDLCELIGGGTPKTTVSEYWGGNIPWLSVTDFNTGRKFCFDAEKKITERGLKESSTKILKKGQIIISARGTVGVISMLGKDMAFNQSNYGVDAKKELTTNDFLYYLLKDNLANFISVSYGAVFDTITKETFNQINISLPTLPEQNLIAETLSSLDDKIDLLHRQNKTLEALAETLFRQWFVEEVEESWENYRIGDLDIYVTDFVANGSFASLKENVTLINDREDYALFMRNTDLKSGFVQKVYVDKHSYDFLAKSKLFGGEVIISNVADVGSVHLCPKLNIPMTLGNNVIMLNSKFNLFLYLLFKSTVGQGLIYGITSGSAQQKFNKTDFRNIKIAIPSKEAMIEFHNRVEILFEKIERNQNQIKTLTQLRDTLLPKLMSGEVRIEN